jgi:uncharacterized protein YqhQ
MSQAPFYYGGQAVMEGVMMRGRRTMAIAVRAPNGQIVVYEEELQPGPVLKRVRNLPFVRGAVVLWDTLILGTRALLFSANVSLQEEPEEGAEADEPVTLGGPLLWLTMAVSLAFAIGLFFMTPLLVSWVAERFVDSHFAVNVIEGLLRLALLIGYLALIAKMPDIRRVFAYHGAEHMTINAYEKKLPVEVPNVRKQSLEHVRCGTGFLLLVVLISILVFTLLGRPSLFWLIASRILLVPVIAAIAYEVIRIGAAHAENPVMRVILAPGLLLQRLTTRRPEDDMLEVAIAAFKRVLVADGLMTAADLKDGVVPVDQTGRPVLPELVPGVAAD